MQYDNTSNLADILILIIQRAITFPYVCKVTLEYIVEMLIQFRNLLVISCIPILTFSRHILTYLQIEYLVTLDERCDGTLE